MSTADTIALAAAAEAEGLECLLVGGNAVNLHAYYRTTFDVDLLVPETHASRWLSYFEQQGYTVFHRTSNFIRLQWAADRAGALPVDLMLADEETFRKLRRDSLRQDLGEGKTLLIPSALHLVAMKLHALRSPHRAANRPDLLDVKHLLKTAKIDTSGKEFQQIAARYATEAIRDRLLRELAEDQ